MLSEISDTQKNKCVMIPPILVPMVVKIQTEGRMQAARDWERWNEEFMFKADCFSLATHSNVLAWRIPGMGEPAVYGVAQSRTQLKRLSSSGGGGGYSNRSSSGSSSSNNRSSKSCSVTLCLTLCDPIDWSTPDSSAPHYLPEFAQTHVY